MEIGFIKLHRKLLDWEWYSDHPTLILFIHILLNTNYEDSRYRGELIPCGSSVCGLKALSAQTGLSVQQVRTSLDKLTSTGEITRKTSNKYSIISISNWNDYQGSNKQITNEQQTDNKQITPSKEAKKLRSKESKDIRDKAVLAYNDFAGEYNLPKVQKMTDGRDSKLDARLNDCGGLDGWDAALEKILGSSFLRGEKTDWKANFDFLMVQGNFIKLMEGNYDDRPNTGNTNGNNKPNSIHKQREELLVTGW